MSIGSSISVQMAKQSKIIASQAMKLKCLVTENKILDLEDNLTLNLVKMKTSDLTWYIPM
jgi:hypothetical protein